MLILWRAVLFVCLCFAVRARYYIKGAFEPHGRYGPYGPYGPPHRPPQGFPYVSRVEEADSTLILTHVVFRHGNRTAEPSELYPNDPYLNYSYFPIGNGQLTNIGKVKEYMIGQDLRARYNSFLGDYYIPDLVDAVSTDKNRTKASLELVLASLFAPRGEQIWNFALNWQPVPYNFHPTDQDPVLYGISCPNYIKNYQDLVTSAKFQAEWNKNKQVFDYISKHSGLNVTTYQDVYDLYFGLSTEEEYGLELPYWTKSVWPKIVTDMSVKEYFVETGTTKLATIAAGFYIKKVIEDTKRKVQNLEEGPKIYLYSAHENNVAEIQVVLDVFKNPHVPTYGSYFIIEVHNINGVVGLKMYYNHWTNKGLELLTIPNCGVFCPLDTFERLYAEYIPASEDVCYQID